MNKNLVTQGELGALTDSLGALADNLNQHVNDSLTLAHGWSLEFSSYFDTGGNYHTDFGASTPQVIPGLFNTGVNDDFSLNVPGTLEKHWSLVQSPYPAGTPVFIESPVYAGDGQISPASQFIGVNINGNSGSLQGAYRYRLTFSLAGLNPATAIITVKAAGVSIHWSSLANVYLNGTPLGITFNPLPNVPFFSFLITTGFVSGTNTLDFLWGNNGNNPQGMTCELSGTAFIGGPAVIPTLFNTGLAADGTLAAASSVDPHWTLISSADVTAPGPSTYVVNDTGGVYPFGQQPSSLWSPNGPRSKWISAKANLSSLPPAPVEPNALAAGNYTYRLTFSLAGFNPTTTVVKGTWVSDNSTTAILLNGQPTGITGPSDFTGQPSTSFVITTGFVSGNNTLDFVINNTTLGASGLRVEINGTAQSTGTNSPGRVLRLSIGNTELFIPAQLSGGIDGKPDTVIPVESGANAPLIADPASDLIVGSPTSCALVTTFADLITNITDSANAQLFKHAGDIPENVHGGASWQQDTISSSAGYLVGRRSVNIVVNGVAYKLVADTSPRGPLH